MARAAAAAGGRLSAVPTAAPGLLVDGHVHYHDCYEAAPFFEGVTRNFAANAQELDLAERPPGCLLFTESAWDHYFRVFRDEPERLAPAGWRFERTQEPDSLLARRDGEPPLFLVAGRQVAAAEGLEVLALGTDAEFEDRRPLAETLERVRASGALAVVPWGFGKWSFARRRMVESLVERAAPGELFLGDNGGRCGLGPRPRLFDAARERGLAVVPGSDPLPFPRQNRAAGSYGFYLEGGLDPARPSASIKALIRSQPGPLRFVGRLESLVGFCRDQVGMQLWKRGIGVPRRERAG